MRGKRRANTIYDYARGDGWILTATGDHWKAEHRPGHRFEVVLYYTHDQRIETHETTSIDTLLTQLLDVGGQYGAYEGTKPEAHTEFGDQPRAVRMQRHAPDIYDALGGARGLSESLCVRAAEEFGSTWREKSGQEWAERVRGVGEGRGSSIEQERKRLGIA